MQRITLDNAVGFTLAVLFAIVMGVSMRAILVGDFMTPGKLMSEQVRQTLQITGLAGGLAALLAWWLQGFAAERGFVIRLLFGVAIFSIAFWSLGGLLRVIFGYINYPNQQDWSVTGLYWASIGNFYTFVVDMLVPLRIAFFALLLTAGLYLAVVGPQRSRA
jgi:hypothetical protein